MDKFKYIPLYILALLLIILVLLEGWTYYLGTTDVTFERLVGTKPYKEIKEMSLRRYKEGAISPHLFTIRTDNEKKIIEKLSRDCKLDKVGIERLPKEVYETDEEMVEVIKKSPYIYLSSKFNLSNPSEGRACILFRDEANLYLFVNGNL